MFLRAVLVLLPVTRRPDSMYGASVWRKPRRCRRRGRWSKTSLRTRTRSHLRSRHVGPVDVVDVVDVAHLNKPRHVLFCCDSLTVSLNCACSVRAVQREEGVRIAMDTRACRHRVRGTGFVRGDVGDGPIRCGPSSTNCASNSRQRAKTPATRAQAEESDRDQVRAEATSDTRREVLGLRRHDSRATGTARNNSNPAPRFSAVLSAKEPSSGQDDLYCEGDD